MQNAEKALSSQFESKDEYSFGEVPERNPTWSLPLGTTSAETVSPTTSSPTVSRHHDSSWSHTKGNCVPTDLFLLAIRFCRRCCDKLFLLERHSEIRCCDKFFLSKPASQIRYCGALFSFGPKPTKSLLRHTFSPSDTHGNGPATNLFFVAAPTKRCCEESHPRNLVATPPSSGSKIHGHVVGTHLSSWSHSLKPFLRRTLPLGSAPTETVLRHPSFLDTYGYVVGTNLSRWSWVSEDGDTTTRVSWTDTHGNTVETNLFLLKSHLCSWSQTYKKAVRTNPSSGSHTCGDDCATHVLSWNDTHGSSVATNKIPSLW